MPAWVVAKRLSYSSDQDLGLYLLSLAQASTLRSCKMPFVTLTNPELGIPGNVPA